MTPGELLVLAAMAMGAEPDAMAEVVLVSLRKDGKVGLASTACCEGSTATILAGAIGRIGSGIHEGEEIVR